MREYYIPTGRSQAELVEKRSRFIGQVWRVSSEEEARARMMSQPGDEFFEKRADYIIRNTGETSALRLQILELMNKLGL